MSKADKTPTWVIVVRKIEEGRGAQIDSVLPGTDEGREASLAYVRERAFLSMGGDIRTVNAWETRSLRVNGGAVKAGDQVWIVSTQRPFWDDEWKLEEAFASRRAALEFLEEQIDEAMPSAAVRIPAIEIIPAEISDPAGNKNKDYYAQEHDLPKEEAE